MSRPEAWTNWKAAVEALVRQTAGALALYKNPSATIEQTGFDEKLAGIADGLAKCDAAAAAVGCESERVAVSRTLYRLQKDAVKCAGRVRKEASALHLDDPNAVLRWHAEEMLPVERLWHAVRRGEIDSEMAERVLQELSTTETSVARVETPEWDGATLTARGTSKTFKQPAPDQRRILNAFQTARWPTRIDNPFPQHASDRSLTKAELVARKAHLRKAVDNLTRSLRNHHPSIPVTFSTDGTQGIVWAWVEVPEEQLRRS
jgi:hypothetical protein